MKKISLNFSGYWADKNQGSIPSWSGIYCVYRGKDYGQTVGISQLLYVGESDNVRDRIIYHERRADWRRYLYTGETLIFSTALTFSDRAQAEAAIINHHKPILNTEYLNSFHFEDTEMALLGQTLELSPYFIVGGSMSFLSSLFSTKNPAYPW